MGRAIVIPLYDHTPESEVREILEELERIGLDRALVVAGYITDDDLEQDADDDSPGWRLVSELDAPAPIPGRPGWRRDRHGREWYSAAWIGDQA